MKISVQFKGLLKVLVILIIFLIKDNVKALEETPDYCFGYARYMAGPIEECDDYICETTEDGNNLCMPVCHWSDMTQIVEINEYKCYEGNEYGFETITDVVIPTNLDKYDGSLHTGVELIYSITIANDAFANKNITSIIIPDTVTSIREKAFYNNNIEAITIPSSVVRIEKLAFANNNITKVINKSNIANSILKDNIGSTDTNDLIFGANCKQLEDGQTTCLGEKNINISNTEIVDNEENNKPSNDDKYEEIDRNPNDSNSSLENKDMVNNPKTLDTNMQIFGLTVLFSLIAIMLMLLKMKKSKHTKNSN